MPSGVLALRGLPLLLRLCLSALVLALLRARITEPIQRRVAAPLRRGVALRGRGLLPGLLALLVRGGLRRLRGALLLALWRGWNGVAGIGLVCPPIARHPGLCAILRGLNGILRLGHMHLPLPLRLLGGGILRRLIHLRRGVAHLPGLSSLRRVRLPGGLLRLLRRRGRLRKPDIAMIADASGLRGSTGRAGLRLRVHIHLWRWLTLGSGARGNSGSNPGPVAVHGIRQFIQLRRHRLRVASKAPQVADFAHRPIHDGLQPIHHRPFLFRLPDHPRKPVLHILHRRHDLFP